MANASQLSKFGLFVKAREIDQARDALHHLQLLSIDQRKTWFEENGDLLNAIFNRFIDDSNALLNAVEMDDESLQLSYRIVEGLRESMHLVGEMVYQSQELEA